jgi:hypothetical protein
MVVDVAQRLAQPHLDEAAGPIRVRDHHRFGVPGGE